MRCADWGERSVRWAGVRSETVEVRGTSVHCLAADPPTALDAAPVHLFVPNPAGSATNWLDVMAEMPRSGQLVAVDLPGTIAGHTASPSHRAANVEASARFLRAFTEALGLEQVVVHGWSAGAMIALLYADLAPEQVAGVVLVSPALAPSLGGGEARLWRTVGRAGLAIAPPVSRVMLRVFGRRLLDQKVQFLADPATIASSRWNTGGDLTRMSPEITDLMRLEMAAVEPKQMASWVTVMTSLMSLMFVRRERVFEAMGRVAAPTLLLWGDDDGLIGRDWIDDWSARRPDWTLTVLGEVGHAPPWEAPADYAHAVDDWMGAT